MRYFYCIGIILLINFNAFSQIPKITWGESGEMGKEEHFKKIIGVDEDGFFTLKSIDNNLYLERYSSGALMEKEFSSELELPLKYGVKAELMEIYYKEGQLILFTSTPIPKGNQKALYIQQLKKDGSFKSKSKKVAEFQNLPGVENVHIDYNEQLKEFIVRIDPFFTIYNNEVFKIKSFNVYLEEKTSQELVLPLLGREFRIDQFILGNQRHSVFLVNPINNAKNGRSSSRKKPKQTILVYYPELGKYKNFQLVLKRNKPEKIFMTILDSEKLFVSGFYRARSSRDASLGGVFHRTLNLNTQKFLPQAPKSGFKDFSREFKEEFNREESGENIEQRYSYDIKDVVVINEKKYVMLAEQNYIVDKSFVTPGDENEVSIFHYHCNDILAVVIDNGKITWINRIPKLQQSVNDDGRYLSFYHCFDKYKNLRIIYNDHPSNIDREKLDSKKEFKIGQARLPKCRVTMATVFQDGSVDYTSFLGNDKRTIINTDMLYGTPDLIMLIGREKDIYKVGRYTF